MKLKLTYILFLVFLLPLTAFSQEEVDGEEDYEEFNQKEIDSLKNLITTDLHDSLKAKYYSEIARFSQVSDTVIKYANLSLPLCKNTDYLLLGQNYYSLGQAANINGEYKNALPYVYKAVVFVEKINDPQYIALTYQLLSYVYDNLNNIDSAVFYMTKVMEIGNRLKDTAMVAECYQDLGTMHGERDLYKESKMYFRKALVLDSLSRNRFQYALDLFLLVQVIDNQNLDSVQEFFTARNYMAKVVNVLDTVNTYYKYLAYGTFASIYLKLAQKTKQNKYADSSRYFYEKAELFFKNSGGVNNYRLFKYINVDYLLYYKQYNKALEVMRELEDTFDENSSTLQYADFHTKYKDIYLALGDYKNAYFHAEKQHEYERDNYNDSTLSALSDSKAQQIIVFYRPRDIVSGDFYRAGKCGKYSVMITADCTGHGIPGAFLSMLGLSALKEFMVTEYDAENPGTVLDRIREFIKTTLVSPQKGKSVDDGMDMTVCCFDFEKMEMRYAIANQTAVIVRKGEIIKLKGDNMPVGHYMWGKEHFQTFSVKIEKGDMIYTFSDGIQDQLGKSGTRKFLLKKLLALLAGFAEKPVDEQCRILEETITAWRGSTPQVDDMTMIGIRVN